ncbi:MAG: substrate-binding domain-containing protein [Tepidisphaeraceae bacterium]
MPDNPQRHRRPVIGVIVNNVGGYSRGVVRGITSFAFARAWTCRVQGVNEASMMTRIEDYDGLIMQAASAEQASLLAATRTPLVNVSSALPVTRFTSVVSDDIAVGRLGADYLLRRGYRQFVFVGSDPREFVKLRHQGFDARLREASQACTLIDDESTLAAVLGSMPKPIAVMGCNDRAALAALDACRDVSLRVPDDVAVLGVDNDDLIQSLAYPPLSTINTARERIGFEAAAVLERLMQPAAHAPPPESPRLIPPTGVITRQSTDRIAIEDTDVADALRYIHAHAGRPITVETILREIPLSRRQLERRFRAALGRSMLDEILRCRLDRAKQLLGETELALPQVAIASGFTSASYFNVVFHKSVGTTPGEYRRRLGRGTPV